jgi:hypothetical protein
MPAADERDTQPKAHSAVRLGVRVSHFATTPCAQRVRDRGNEALEV